MAEVDISKIQLPDGITYNLKSGTKGVGEVDISKIVLPDGTVCNIKGGVLTTKSIIANGTYNALSDDADGYSEVTVAVPNTYAAGDEGKVVQNGSLVSQTTRSVTENGTYDTTTNNSTVVNVETSNAYDPVYDYSSYYITVDEIIESEITSNGYFIIRLQISVTTAIPSSSTPAIVIFQIPTGYNRFSSVVLQGNSKGQASTSYLTFQKNTKTGLLEIKKQSGATISVTGNYPYTFSCLAKLS